MMEVNYIVKAFLSIVLITNGTETRGTETRILGFFGVKTSFRNDMNLQIYLKCSIKVVFISNFFD